MSNERKSPKSCSRPVKFNFRLHSCYHPLRAGTKLVTQAFNRLLSNAIKLTAVALMFLVLAFVSFSPLALTSSYAQDSKNEPIVFLGDNNYAPYEFLEDGKPAGANVDLLNAIGKVLGKKIDIRLMNWAMAQKQVQEEKGYALTLMSKNEQRLKLYDFTEPTFTSTFSFFVRAEKVSSFDIKALSGKRIGILPAGFPEAFLTKNNPEATYVPIKNDWDGFRKLLRGEIDTVATNNWVGYFSLKKHEISSIRSVPSPFAKKIVSIAIPKGNPALVHQINGALQVLYKTGEFERIVDKWSSQKVVLIEQRRVWELYGAAGLTAVALILLILALHFSNSKSAALAREIIEHKITLDALKESESKYRNLVETSHDLIWSVDAEGKFIFVNKEGAMHILGYEVEEMIGKSLAYFKTPKQAEDDLNMFSMIKEEGKTSNYETSYRKKDGSFVFMKFNAVAIKDSSGKILGTTGTAQDITQQKKNKEALQEAKAEAEEANRAKSEFLANMSHDLRTPLNAIMGFSEMMTENTFGSLGDPHYEEYALDIRKSGRLLLSMIDDVLDLSKIEAGKYYLVEQNINVPLAIKASVKMLQKQAGVKKINLVNSCKPDLPKLYGDEKAVTQVVNNLLSNAIKFTPEEGEVTVKAWKSMDNKFNIKVTDTGIGMSKEDITKALNPFEQVESQHSRDHEGTGLGLYLCCRFIDLHGGKIIFESEIDKGTAVTVSFPQERVVMDA